MWSKGGAPKREHSRGAERRDSFEVGDRVKMQLKREDGL